LVVQWSKAYQAKEDLIATCRNQIREFCE